LEGYVGATLPKISTVISRPHKLFLCFQIHFLYHRVNLLSGYYLCNFKFSVKKLRALQQPLIFHRPIVFSLYQTVRRHILKYDNLQTHFTCNVLVLYFH